MHIGRDIVIQKHGTLLDASSPGVQRAHRLVISAAHALVVTEPDLKPSRLIKRATATLNKAWVRGYKAPTALPKSGH